jgi:hypothetical protein
VPFFVFFFFVGFWSKQCSNRYLLFRACVVGKNYADAWFGAIHNAYTKADIHTLEEIGQLTRYSRFKKSRKLRGNESWIVSPYSLTQYDLFLDPHFRAGTTVELDFMASHAQIFGCVSLGLDRATINPVTLGFIDRFAHAPAGQCTMTVSPTSAGKVDVGTYK